MKRFRLPRVPSAFALGVALACGPAPDPEQELRRTIASILEAVEKRDPDDVLRHVDPAIRTEAGARQPSLDYGAVRSVVLEFLLRDEPLGVRPVAIQIHPAEPDGSRRVEAEVWFARGGPLLGSEAAPPAGSVRYRFDLRFERRNETWLVVGGRFERVGGA